MYKSVSEKAKIKSDLFLLANWLYCTHGITVNFGIDEENEWSEETESISICSKANYRSQLHTLLHEAGHMILCRDKKLYKKNFPYAQAAKDSRDHRVDVLREEVWAWEKGLEIAHQLSIKIDRKWYDKHSRNALWTYIKWVFAPEWTRRPWKF